MVSAEFPSFWLVHFSTFGLVPRILCAALSPNLQAPLQSSLFLLPSIQQQLSPRQQVPLSSKVPLPLQIQFFVWSPRQRSLHRGFPSRLRSWFQRLLVPPPSTISPSWDVSAYRTALNIRVSAAVCQLLSVSGICVCLLPLLCGTAFQLQLFQLSVGLQTALFDFSPVLQVGLQMPLETPFQ